MSTPIYMHREIKRVGPLYRDRHVNLTFMVVTERSAGEFDAIKVKIKQRGMKGSSIRVYKSRKIKKIVRINGNKFEYVSAKNNKKPLGFRVSHGWFIRSVIGHGVLRSADMRGLVLNTINTIVELGG